MFTKVTREQMEAKMEGGKTPFDAARKNAAFIHKRYRGDRTCTIINVSRKNETVTFRREGYGQTQRVVSAADFDRIFGGWTDNLAARREREWEIAKEIASVIDEAYAEHDAFLVREAFATGDLAAVTNLVTSLRERVLDAESALVDEREESRSLRNQLDAHLDYGVITYY